jgi:hypothetical protein
MTRRARTSGQAGDCRNEPLLRCLGHDETTNKRAHRPCRNVENVELEIDHGPLREAVRVLSLRAGARAWRYSTLEAPAGRRLQA